MKNSTAMISGGMSIEFDQVTLKRVMRQLSALEEIDQAKAIQVGLTKGIDYINKFVRRATKTQFKVRKGNLSGSVMRKYIKKRVAAYGAFSRPKGAAAHLLEYGTKERFTKSGAKRGRVTPSLFKTNIIETKGSAAMRIASDAITNEIYRIISRN